jgi:hypothetical protein
MLCSNNYPLKQSHMNVVTPNVLVYKQPVITDDQPTISWNNIVDEGAINGWYVTMQLSTAKTLIPYEREDHSVDPKIMGGMDFDNHLCDRPELQPAFYEHTLFDDTGIDDEEKYERDRRLTKKIFRQNRNSFFKKVWTQTKNSNPVLEKIESLETLVSVTESSNLDPRTWLFAKDDQEPDSKSLFQLEVVTLTLKNQVVGARFGSDFLLKVDNKKKLEMTFPYKNCEVSASHSEDERRVDLQWDMLPFFPIFQ